MMTASFLLTLTQISFDNDRLSLSLVANGQEIPLITCCINILIAVAVHSEHTY
jgi:hypothetical protein